MVRTIEDVVGTAETQKNMSGPTVPCARRTWKKTKKNDPSRRTLSENKLSPRRGRELLQQRHRRSELLQKCRRNDTCPPTVKPPEKSAQKRAGCYKTEERITKLEEAYTCNHVFLAKYYPSVELSKLELASEQISEHPQAQGQHVNDLFNRVANKLPFSLSC